LKLLNYFSIDKETGVKHNGAVGHEVAERATTLGGYPFADYRGGGFLECGLGDLLYLSEFKSRENLAMPVRESVKRLLAIRSGDICAFPSCGAALSKDGLDAPTAIIGEIAHIVGEKEGSARHDPAVPLEELNGYDNLIYLCPVHHAQIDKQPEDFSAQDLREMKKNHVDTVKQVIASAFADVGFPELREATLWFESFSAQDSNSDFSITAPEAKIQKNSLGSEARFFITQGLSVVQTVRDYIEAVSQTDSDFPERLKSGFLEKYHEERRKGHTGEELFEHMREFAEQGFKKASQRAAGVAVLVYLFESCEVFEK